MEASVYDSRIFSRTDAFAATETVLSSWADVEPADPTSDFFTCWHMWGLRELIVSSSDAAAMRYGRAPNRYPRDQSEFLLLEYYQTGTCIGHAGDTAFRNTPDHINLIDMSRGFSAVTTAMTTRDLLIPHAAIGYDPSIHPALSSVECNSPRGRVLSHVISTLPSRVARLMAHEAEGFEHELLDVVRSLLLIPEGHEPAAVKRARRLAIESYIEARILDPDLNAEALCAAFGVSRASLYRHFGGKDGVAAQIRNRRLIAARHDLLAAPKVRGLIRSVSERYGFYDAAHFNREFRKLFDQAPSEVVAAEGKEIWTSVSPTQLLADWQDRLLR